VIFFSRRVAWRNVLQLVFSHGICEQSRVLSCCEFQKATVLMHRPTGMLGGLIEVLSLGVVVVVVCFLPLFYGLSQFVNHHYVVVRSSVTACEDS
jgi:hypothetical protein